MFFEVSSLTYHGPITIRLSLNKAPRRRLAARGETPAAFGRRCIPAGGVAPRSNTPGILGRRALPAGRLATLGAAPAFHHGLLPCRHCVRWRCLERLRATAAAPVAKRSIVAGSGTGAAWFTVTSVSE